MDIKFDKDLVKHFINKLGISISRYKKNKHDEMVSLEPEGVCHGHALLGLIIDPFLLDEGEKIPTNHTNHRESLEIAKVFLELGYQVDVISKLRSTFVPQKKYTFYVNLRTNFKNASKYLNKDCIKIAHLDVSHWLFSNYAALGRARDLQERRSIASSSFRHITPNYAIEHCDYATMLGNEFTIGTYAYADKQIYRTNLLTCLSYDWPENKDFKGCKNNFLWLGSSGFVHKGLDLVLEAFTDLPHLNLTVCGPIHEDPEFKRDFHKELFDTPNIETKGWVDIDSSEFIEIINNNVAIIFPSCAEGSNGGVITCMKAGIIPLVSVETGVDIDPSYGKLLKNSSIDAIKNSLMEISQLPENKLKEMTRSAWEYARNNHTVEEFHLQYRNAITDIVSRENKRRNNKISLLKQD